MFDTYAFVKKKSEDAYDATKEIAGNAYEAVADSAESVSSAIKEKFVSNVHLTTVEGKIKVKRSVSKAKKPPES